MRPFIAFIHKQSGNSFGVSFPDLPHCNSSGRTIDEARGNAEFALALHWRRLENTGRPAPRPSYMHELDWSQDHITEGLVTLITPPQAA
jgi:predicted RNase H-like HicB family nuclease